MLLLDFRRFLKKPNAREASVEFGKSDRLVIVTGANQSLDYREIREQSQKSRRPKARSSMLRCNGQVCSYSVAM